MKKTVIAAICIVLVFVANGCLKTRDKAINQIEEDELRPVSSILLSEEDAKKLNEKLQVHLYFSDEDGTRLVREIRYVDMNEAKQGTEQLAALLVKELVKGPSNTTLKPTIPEGAALRSPVKIENRTAIVDMTKEFVDNHPGGKEAEEMTIFSIVNTLTELKDIEKVRPYLQGFTANTYLEEGYYMEYGVEQYRDQIKAVYDAGYSEWLFWNSRNTYVEEAFLPE
jgi:germination protein M